MNRFLTLFATALLTFGLAAGDADAAKRFGGGGSIGKQRESINQQAAPRPPAQAPAATPAPAAPAPAAPTGNRWLGPLAGLAAGGLLGAMLFGHGFSGIGFMDVLIVALLIGAVFFALRMLRRPRPEQPVQYSALGGGGSGETPAPFGAAPSGNPMQTARPAENVPPGFQADAFLRNAKTSFIRLQAANDAKDLNDIREYTTPEMFAEISMQIAERGNEPQKTEVVSLNAELLEVTTESDVAIASTRFSGLIRETAGAAPEPFDEVWHVQKNLKDPRSVWLISGIQQVS